MNTVLNTVSGDIFIGSGTIFGHDCMLLTGRHEFEFGRRRKLTGTGREVPRAGFDIRIGEGCWIASGAIVTGGVTIGDNVVIAAGACVVADVPSGVMVAGIPARVVKTLSHELTPA
jgi:acetyltransferase-like isoleucine patch superfamily enzyme